MSGCLPDDPGVIPFYDIPVVALDEEAVSRYFRIEIYGVFILSGESPKMPSMNSNCTDCKQPYSSP